MDVLKIVLAALMIVLEIVLIIAVLLQPGEDGGLGAIAGATDSYIGKGNNKSKEAKLGLFTKILVVTIVVIAVVCVVLK